MKKTDDNIEMLAEDIINALNFRELINYATQSQADYLGALTEEEFSEEWQNFYYGKEEESDRWYLTIRGGLKDE